MSFSLYDATVPTYRQIVGATKEILEKAQTWVEQEGLSEDEIIQTRLIDDMYDFAYQVKSVGVHSIGSIEGVREGVFSPDMTDPPSSFAALIARLEDVDAALANVEREEVDGFLGKPVEFRMPQFDVVMPFVAENFLLSFSQPNFFFHATTAYDILRAKGMDIGKRHFLGKPRIERV